LLLKAICRKSCTSLKTLLFQNKIEQRFCCSRLFLEKVYRFLSEYEYEYAIVRSASLFVEFQLEKDREVCVNIVVKAGV
jgi:hypothetical protein